MRSLALVLSIVLAFALAGCGDDSPAPSPTPTPITALRVHVEPELDWLLTEIDAFAADEGLDLELVALDEADLVVAGEAEPGGSYGTGVTIRHWVPVTGPSALATDIPMAAIAGLIAGSPTDWSPRPGEPIAVSLIVPEEPRPPLEQWSDAISATGARTMSLDAIPDALAADRGALALVPLDAVDPRVSSLAVDGVDVVFAGGDGYPLREVVYVESQVELSRALIDGLALRLGIVEPEPILLRATGDIIPARCVHAKHEQYGDPAHAFRELGPWLAEADLTVGSLDAAISDAGPPFGCVETFSLLAPARAIEGLELSGFDVITVATNHVKDCGQIACGDDAFFQTLLNLQAAGIATVGGGADLTEARAPAVVEVDGVRFAFLGYDEIASYYHAAPGVPGTAPLLEQYLREDVAAARAIADVVVVLPQWGVEYTHDPTFSQQALARAAVEAGAGLVIGNHPHWVQANEVIDGAFVAYALGNFVFDQDWSVPTQQGVVLDIAFHGTKLAGVRLHPVRIIDEHQPVFAEPAEAAQILDAIAAASGRLN